MTKRNSKHARPSAESSRVRADEPGKQHADDRLRGAELADDFADAERDSCVVIHHRDERESDS